MWAALAAARPDSAPQYSNPSVSKFREQMQFSAEQSAQLDSIFALYLAAADTAPPVCLRAKDEDILRILTPEQRAKYDILKQEWKERQAAALKQGKRRGHSAHQHP